MKHYLMIAALFASVFSGSEKASATPNYADWSLDPSGNSGTGTFSGVVGAPDFAFTVTGQNDPSSTTVDDGDDFDNSQWEAIFGEGNNQESLRFGRNPSSNLTTSVLTISFSKPVNSSSLAFAVTDLEGEDAVISASLNGVPVASETVAAWFQGLFDSNPATTGSPHLPSGFDVANAAVVAQFDSDGMLSDEILNPTSTESASAWFIPNTLIDTLVITHRNRFGDAASMHVYMAAEDSESVDSAIFSDQFEAPNQ